MKQLTYLLLFTWLFTSCASFKSPDFSQVRIGMSKEEVSKRLGNKYTIISAKKYDDGVLEILQYLRVPAITATSDLDYNWLFFFNNKLDEWGPKSNYSPFHDYNYHRKNKSR